MNIPSPERAIRPHANAALLAGIYVLSSVVYIVVSSHLAAVTSRSVEQMEQFERTKGILFVVSTGALLYVVALLLLRRVKRQQELLATQRETLIASEHRALAGLFAASVAHDINNVLSVARGSAELISEPAVGLEAKTRASGAMQRAFDDLASLSQRLMSLGRERHDGSRSERDLVAVVERAVQLAKRHERVRKCSVTTKLGDSVILPVDEILIDRMLLNLILNAADATGGAGRIEVRLRDDGQAVLIEVHDDGPGIPDEAKQAIFEAFYTSKPHGLGLGLVSVKVCAEDHRGSVEVFRSDLGGAAFRVRLPRPV